MAASKKAKEVIEKAVKRVSSAKETSKGKEVSDSMDDKNIGCPILGLGVKFYPSEEVRINKALTSKSYNGKILLIEGLEDGIVKIGVEGIIGVFKCKSVKDVTYDVMKDNGWE